MKAVRGLAPILVLLLGGFAACSAPAKKGILTPEELKERAQRYEARYRLPAGDARYAATRHPGLDNDEAYAVFATLAKKLEISALTLDDASALEDVAQLDPATRNRLVEGATSDAAVAAVARLKDAFGYEFRIREIGILPVVSGTVLERATNPGFVAAARVIHDRKPDARLPLRAIDASSELAAVSVAELKHALDRFAALEIDLGVREVNVRTLQVLAYTAHRPRALEALAMLRLRLRDFDATSVTPEGLDAIAAIASTALDETLNETLGTRFGKHMTTLDGRWARTIAVLASQPGAGAVLSLLDAELPELRFEDEADARGVAEIAAVGTEGRALSALSTAFRAGAQVEVLDAAGTQFLVVLVSEPAILDTVKVLHGAWPSWHATPSQLPAIRALNGAPGLGKLALTLERRLGFEIGSQLTPEVSKALNVLAREEAAAIADALHLVFPRLRVHDMTALHELHELIAEGVAPADVLRLDLDSFSGNLGPRIRSAIAAKARAKRGG